MSEVERQVGLPVVTGKSSDSLMCDDDSSVGHSHSSEQPRQSLSVLVTVIGCFYGSTCSH